MVKGRIHCLWSLWPIAYLFTARIWCNDPVGKSIHVKSLPISLQVWLLSTTQFLPGVILCSGSVQATLLSVGVWPLLYCYQDEMERKRPKGTSAFQSNHKRVVQRGKLRSHQIIKKSRGVIFPGCFHNKCFLWNWHHRCTHFIVNCCIFMVFLSCWPFGKFSSYDLKWFLTFPLEL